jgi:hypothetical protein
MKLPSIKAIKYGIGKNSPTILTILSIGGLIGTTIMAVNATPKVIRLIEEEKEYRADALEQAEDDSWSEPMTKAEIFKLSWTYYIPTVAMGAATVACIIGANTINLKRSAALTSAYYLSETALKEYQAKVIKTIGEKKAQLIKDEISQDHVDKTKRDGKTVIITGNGDTLCLDTSSGRYFKSSMDKIRKAENEINRQLISENYLSLNEIYGIMDLGPVSTGRELGWDLGYQGKLEFDISTCMAEDDQPCITIDFNAIPRPKY